MRRVITNVAGALYATQLSYPSRKHFSNLNRLMAKDCTEIGYLLLFSHSIAQRGGNCQRLCGYSVVLYKIRYVRKVMYSFMYT